MVNLGGESVSGCITEQEGCRSDEFLCRSRYEKMFGMMSGDDITRLDVDDAYSRYSIFAPDRFYGEYVLGDYRLHSREEKNDCKCDDRS